MFEFLLRCITLTGYFVKAYFSSLYGVWKLSKLKACPVSILGGTRLNKDSIYIKKAEDLALLLANKGITVLTGGGPGIMQAANCGFKKANLHKNVVSSYGISLKGLDVDVFDQCADTIIELNYYLARKILLTKYSIAYVFFPGGFGTIDELFELLTQMQIKKQEKALIILIGSEFWNDFVNWLRDFPLSFGLITKEHFELFFLTDDLNEVIEIINKKCIK